MTVDEESQLVSHVGRCRPGSRSSTRPDDPRPMHSGIPTTLEPLGCGLWPQFYASPCQCSEGRENIDPRAALGNLLICEGLYPRPAFPMIVSGRCAHAEEIDMRVLVIEDDEETAEFIAQGLGDEGHMVAIARDGDCGLSQALSGGHDVLVVDRMVPRRDGLTLVTMLRAENINTPILFLSTLSGIDDRVLGLDAGGDDYLVKPFALAELQARVNALGRRAREDRPTRIRVGALELDLIAHAATWAGRNLDLLPREFALLEYFARHADQLVTKSMLLEHVWGFRFDPKTSLVETHLSRLRIKLEQVRAGNLIQTIRGGGYRLHVATASPE
jgi:two-component system OmpR family response regulator